MAAVVMAAANRAILTAAEQGDVEEVGRQLAWAPGRRGGGTCASSSSSHGSDTKGEEDGGG